MKELYVFAAAIDLFSFLSKSSLLSLLSSSMEKHSECQGDKLLLLSYTFTFDGKRCQISVIFCRDTSKVMISDGSSEHSPTRNSDILYSYSLSLIAYNDFCQLINNK